MEKETSIPLEMESEILSHLDPEHLPRFRLISKPWNELVCSLYAKKDQKPITFNSPNEEAGKSVLDFMQLMDNRIQECPFSAFRIHVGLPRVRSPSGSSSEDEARAEALEEVHSVFTIFANKFGSRVKHYNFFATWRYRYNDKLIEILLKESPNLEVLTLEDIGECNTRLSLTKPLPKLKEVRCRLFILRNPLLESIVAAAPNLQTISLLFPHVEDGWPPVQVLVPQLEKIRHIPSIDIKGLFIESDDYSMEFLINVVKLGLRVRSLSLTISHREMVSGNNYEDSFRLLAIWLASLSPTLEELSVEFLNSENRPQGPKLAIPHLANLKKLCINSDTHSPTYNLAMLETRRFPKLATIQLKTRNPGHLFDPNLPFLTVTHLSTRQSGEPVFPGFPVDKIFPNLNGLDIGKVGFDDLKFIFTKMTGLQKLSMKTLTSVWNILSGNEGKDVYETDWLSASLGSSETALEAHSSALDHRGGVLQNQAAVADSASVPSIGNMKNLISLTLDIGRRHGREFLKEITYLSSTKKIPTLTLLRLKRFRVNQEVKLVQRLVARLRECHQEVKMEKFSKYGFGAESDDYNTDAADSESDWEVEDVGISSDESEKGYSSD